MPRLATLRPVATASKAARQTSSSSSRGGAAGPEAAGSSPQRRAATVTTAPLQMGAPAGSQLQVMAAGGVAAADKAVAAVAKPVRAGGQVVLADALRSRLFSAAAGERRHHAAAAAAAADERANYMSSSGSEHEPSSVCLAAMVHDFMQEGEGVHGAGAGAGAAGGAKAAATAKWGRPRCNCDDGVCDALSQPSDSEDAKSVMGKELTEMIQSLAPPASPLEESLLLDTTQAVAKVKEEASLICKDGADTCNNCLRRLVMGELRRRGYNAAICKARWDHAGGYPGGDYEYIDVVVEGGGGAASGSSSSSNNNTNKEERLLVDLDFRAQFEIARPTNSYQALLHSLPPVFAGTPERVHQLVKIMSDGARRSLKKRGLYLPPWRKPEYMRAKWLSAYRRTTNPVPPEHLVVDRHISRDAVGSLAVRGHGWDERFRTAMESHYQTTVREQKQPSTSNVTAEAEEAAGTSSSSGNNVGGASGVHQQQREQEEDPALQQLRKPLGSALTAQFRAMAAAAQASSSSSTTTTTAQGRHRPPDYLLTHQPQQQQQQQAVGARNSKTTSTSTTVTAFTGGVEEGLHQHHRHHRHHQAQQQQQQQQAQQLAAAAKEAELEGRVRGANKMLFSGAINDPTASTTTTTTMVSDLVVGGGTELHIRDNSEWKFPAVKPRSPHRTRMVTGLSSMLTKGRQQQQQQQQQQPQPQQQQQQPLLAAAV